MALLSKAGTFILNTGTGNQSITGIGFQPKVVLFFATKETSAIQDGTKDARGNIGVGIDSTHRATVCADISDDGDLASIHDNTKCLIMDDGSGAGTSQYAADLVSLDADGFTINITQASSAFEVGFLALGGSDLTNVFLKQFTAPASTGIQVTTGVGFKPDAVILFSANITTAPASGVASSGRYSVGFGTDSSHRVALSMRSSFSEQLTNQIFTALNGAGNGHDMQADLTSLDSDGFTLNFSTTNNGAYIWALCLKGGQYYVGSDTQKTSTGTKANTAPNFTPTGIFFASQNQISSGSIQSIPTYITQSAITGSSSRFYFWCASNGGLSNGEAVSVTKGLGMLSISGSTITTSAEADYSSFDPTGFTVNWTTADATAREFIFLAFGSSGVSSTTKDTSVKANIKRTYTQNNSALANLPGGASKTYFYGALYNQPFNQNTIPSLWQIYGATSWLFNSSGAGYSSVSSSDPNKLLLTGLSLPNQIIVQADFTFTTIDYGNSNSRVGLTIYGESSDGIGINLVLRGGTVLGFLDDLVTWGTSYTLPGSPNVGETWTFKAKYDPVAGQFSGKIWKKGSAEPGWQLTWTYIFNTNYKYAGLTADSSSANTTGTFSNFNIYYDDQSAQGTGHQVKANIQNPLGTKTKDNSVRAYIQQVNFTKRYAWRIYDSTGNNFITTWANEVITQDFTTFPTFRGVINGGFGEMVVRLNRKFDDFGEGDDVALNNKVRLYCFDRDAPQGVLIYSGFISGYRPVLDGVDEYVEITVLHDVAKFSYIMLRDGTGNTYVTMSGVDPSQMAKNALNYAISDGSPINYTPSSVDLTNTTAVYSFSLMTIQEALDLIIQLTPSNWYYTIDVNDVFQMHLANMTTPDHTLIIGKHIMYIETWRRFEDMINRVYFVGQGSLFRQNSNTGSITAYGLHAKKNTDKNVQFSTTADLIATNQLTAFDQPEIRTLVKVLDNNGLNPNIGYDIESFKVGQTINIRNLKQGVKTVSYWDQMIWDSDVWDQTLSFTASDIIQIQAITYYPDYIQLEASSRQPTVTRRIEDISQQLQNEQAAGINGAPVIVS